MFSDRSLEVEVIGSIALIEDTATSVSTEQRKHTLAYTPTLRPPARPLPACPPAPCPRNSLQMRNIKRQASSECGKHTRTLTHICGVWSLSCAANEVSNRFRHSSVGRANHRTGIVIPRTTNIFAELRKTIPADQLFVL